MKSILFTVLMGISFMNFASTNENHPTLISKIIAHTTSSLTYPEAAIEEKEEGTVYVSFELSENYTVTNILIEEGVSPALNLKAIEIVDHLIMEENQFVSGRKYILPVKFVIK